MQISIMTQSQYQLLLDFNLVLLQWDQDNNFNQISKINKHTFENFKKKLKEKNKPNDLRRNEKNLKNEKKWLNIKTHLEKREEELLIDLIVSPTCINNQFHKWILHLDHNSNSSNCQLI